MPESDMSALEFKQLDPEDRDWRIFDRLGKGDKKMSKLDRRITAHCKETELLTVRVGHVETKLDGHVTDKEVHPRYKKTVGNPGNPGNKPSWATRRNGLYITVITFLTALVYLAIEVMN